MALTVTLLGTSYSVPEPGDTGYDQQLTNYLKNLATAFPQLSGGTYSLTGELDLGASFGLKSLYYKSRTANPAAAGQIRLASVDSLGFRNNANTADVALAKDTTDNLTFGGAYVTGNPMLSATTTAAQSIPNNALTIVVFGTVATDSDSAYNATTGRYTVPVGKGGDYWISANIDYGAAPGTTPYMQIFKNAVALYGHHAEATTPGGQCSLQITAVARLVAGDIIDIRTLQASGLAVALAATATFNYFTMKRIPT